MGIVFGPEVIVVHWLDQSLQSMYHDLSVADVVSDSKSMWNL